MTVTIAEQLTAYVAKHYPGHVRESAGKPWTFHYRQWVDNVGDKCSQCTSVTIEMHDGSKQTHSVSDMDVAAARIAT